MGRAPTRQLTWQFVLRTFKRVDMIHARYSSEAIAKALVERGAEIGCSPEYLSDIWDHMCKLKREAGVAPNAHPNGNCPQCGHDIGRDHNGARYCSTRCRQRAYRIRKAVAEGRNSPVPKRRARPTKRAIALAEADAFIKARKEALAAASALYALHIKASGGEKECSATPQSDASITPGDETNVTPPEREVEEARHE
jgi:hypothetical protein